MEQIICAIVDDEISSIKFLEKNVLQIPQLKLQIIFKNPVEAKDYLLKHPEVYLAFVDINMSGLSGLELAQLAPDTKIVFTTGHEEFARESWRYKNVLGYLTKPISFKDIMEVVEKIYPVYIAEGIASRYNSTTHLIYTLDSSTLKIAFDKILYIEAIGNYATVYAQDGDYFVPIPLIELQKALPSSIFVRVGKSTIANKNKILGASKNQKKLKLTGGFMCKSSKLYLQNLQFQILALDI